MSPNARKVLSFRAPENRFNLTRENDMTPILKLVLSINIMCTSFFVYSDSLNHLKSPADSLSKVNYYSIGYNGFVGELSDGERNFRMILQDENATTLFLKIAQDSKSTTEARLYAACGLRNMSVSELNEIFEPYKKNKVTVLNVDILRQVEFQDVYEKIVKDGCN